MSAHDLTIPRNRIPTQAQIKSRKANEPLRNVKEVVAEFGFKNAAALHSMLYNKTFPEPDMVGDAPSTSAGRKLYWKLSTLKKEHARRNAGGVK